MGLIDVVGRGQRSEFRRPFAVTSFSAAKPTPKRCFANLSLHQTAAIWTKSLLLAVDRPVVNLSLEWR